MLWWDQVVLEVLLIWDARTIRETDVRDALDQLAGLVSL